MDHRTKTLVQESFALVTPIADDAARLFYGRLFELDPSLRSMFPDDLSDQSRKLMQMLSAAVKGLDRIETLIPVLEQLAVRHVGYGVRREHYETVGAALIWTLEQGLGEAFTADVRLAWTQTYALVSGVMIEAAGAMVSEDAAAETPAMQAQCPYHGSHVAPPISRPVWRSATAMA